MIHKNFNPDGTPNFEQWLLGCDRCTETTPVFTFCNDCGLYHGVQAIANWLIPERRGMPIYCPACLGEQSGTLIDTALHCPACKSNDIRMLFLSGQVFCAQCHDCSALTYGADLPGSIDGWVFNPPS